MQNHMEVETLCSGVEALIFDCDGTLVDTMEFFYPSWVTICDKYGIVFSKQKFYSVSGVPVRKIFEVLLEEQQISLPDGVTVDVMMKEKFALVEASRKVSEPGRIDCVCEIVIAAYRMGIPMAVASSGNRVCVEKDLKANGLCDYFDTVICCEDVGNGKPAPDLFLKAAEKLNVDPTKCRGFEDADLGMQALKNAGMEAVDVREMAGHPYQKLVKVIETDE